MNSEMDGKKIKAVYWPDTESEQGAVLVSGDDVILEMCVTCHGDREEIWIVELHNIEGDFIEVARHNPRFVESFRWS